MGVRFGNYHAESYWSPEYGDIDWNGRWKRLEGRGDVEAYQPTGFDSSDGLIEELSQENCSIYRNEADPDMDMIAVNDPRDGRDYVWFRFQNPDNFEDLLKNVERAALSFMSRFPLENVVALYLDRVSTGNSPEFLDEQ